MTTIFDNMAIKSYAILSGFTLMILLRNLVTFVLNFKKQNKHDYMRENEERERMGRERRDIYSRNFGSEMMTCLRANGECT